MPDITGEAIDRVCTIQQKIVVCRMIFFFGFMMRPVK